jgi:hypothetical protein
MAKFMITEVGRYFVEANSIEEARAGYQVYFLGMDSDGLETYPSEEAYEYSDGSTTYEERG